MGFKFTIPRCLALLVLVTCFLATSTVRAQERAVLSDESLVWNPDRNAALANAKASGRPLILYLYNRFAYSCRDMEQITFRQSAIVNEMKQFELAAVDVSKDADAQRSFQVIKVPTIIFISPTGTELFRAIGYKPPHEFPDYLRAIPRSAPTSSGTSAAPGGKLQEIRATYDPSILVLQERPGTRRVRLQIEAPSSYIVSVMGEFNDWKQDTLPLNRDASGWWWIDLYLSDGLYHYQFFVDGNRVIDPAARFSKYMHELGGKASTVVVGPMPGPEVGPLQPDGKHKVTFNYYNRDVKECFFIAEFLNYAEVKMFPKGDGNFGIQYDLPPGSYEYWYMVNDTWVTDDRNPIGGKRGGSSLIIDPPAR